MGQPHPPNRITAIIRRRKKFAQFSSLPNLLSSNRQMERQREHTKIRYDENAKAYWKVSDARRSSASRVAKMQKVTSRDELTAYVSSCALSWGPSSSRVSV